MKEILFRGKRVDNGEWITGNLFIPDATSRPTQVLLGTDVVRISYDVIPGTVGRHTGLTDKNDNKIFEGDIVDILTENEELGVVEYEDGGFVVNAEGFCVDFLHNISGRDVEVVGNIYDNGELVSDWY